MKHNVTINGKTFKAEENETLYSVLKSSGSGVDAVCGGHGKCGKCRVIVSGAVSEPTEKELRALTDEDIKAGVRLACMTLVKGDCFIRTSGAGNTRIYTDGGLREHIHAPAFEKYGVAVDIGTTTVALRLYDKNGALLSERGCLNPERRFGADVISRMEAAIKGESAEIAAAIREGVNELIKNAAEDADIDPYEIDGAVIVGNTAMLYLLCGDDTEPLTHAPFEAKRLFGETVPASGIGLNALSENASVYFPPCVSAFIGADTAAALCAADMYGRGGIYVLTDIGTNNETVLNDNGDISACSTAAGPAFEGAGISCGMSGGDGAVDKVYLDNGEYRVHVIGGKAPAGICGSGIVDAVACMLERGDLDETGYLEDDVTITGKVTLTRKDVRAVQLAKGAVHAGIKTLLKTSGLECKDVEKLCIAGGFGSYLDKENAAKIGLIPSGLKDKITVAGNGALAGASLLLLSLPLREECENGVKSIKTVQLASNPMFVSEYAESMLFPPQDK